MGVLCYRRLYSRPPLAGIEPPNDNSAGTVLPASGWQRRILLLRYHEDGLYVRRTAPHGRRAEAAGTTGRHTVTSVTVEDEAIMGHPFPICLPECCCDQFGTGDSGYPVGDDPPREQVQNDGDIIVFAFQLVASDIADPDLVGSFRSKVLIENVLLWDGTRQPIVIFLRGRAHADQAHILHDGCVVPFVT